MTGEVLVQPLGCGNCSCWLRHGNLAEQKVGELTGYGICKRYPPNNERTQPMTYGEDWCREHRPFAPPIPMSKIKEYFES